MMFLLVFTTMPVMIFIIVVFNVQIQVLNTNNTSNAEYTAVLLVPMFLSVDTKMQVMVSEVQCRFL